MIINHKMTCVPTRCTYFSDIANLEKRRATPQTPVLWCSVYVATLQLKRQCTHHIIHCAYSLWTVRVTWRLLVSVAVCHVFLVSMSTITVPAHGRSVTNCAICVHEAVLFPAAPKSGESAPIGKCQVGSTRGVVEVARGMFLGGAVQRAGHLRVSVL